jgi:tellurite resistance protein
VNTPLATAMPPAAGSAWSRLAVRTPPPAFAIVMGLGGLALAWTRAHHVLGVPQAIAGAVGLLAVLVFVLLVALFVTKAAQQPQLLAAEWRHPVKGSFVPAFSISVLLVAAVVLPFAPALASALFWFGAVVHLGMTIALIGGWIWHPQLELKMATPAWFIAPVGNILVPLVGVRLGHVETSWFFFAIGFTLWLPMLAIVLSRLFFAGELPERLQPTLAILIAPPSVAFLAYHALTGARDPFASTLYYFAVFVFLLVAMQAPRLIRLPFFLSWWACSFPLAALTVATLAMHQATGRPELLWLGIALLALATAVIFWLLARTVRAVLAREPQLVD